MTEKTPPGTAIAGTGDCFPYAPGRVDGAAKASGQTEYTDDIRIPGMLYGSLVLSPYAHARIVAIHTDRARALPGVHAVLTGDDIPEGPFGRSVRDIPALATKVVRYVGERVAAVAADTPEVAETAAGLVEVEYEPLPAVLDAEEALAPGSGPVHKAPWQYRGAVVTADDHPNLQSQQLLTNTNDMEGALIRSHRTIAHTVRLPARHQGYLEPHLCIARVSENGIDVWAPNKAPYLLRTILAEWMGVPDARVRIQPVAIGGDFGGKGAPMDIPICIALSRATGRAVKLRLRYAQDLMAANPRHSGQIQVRLGLDDRHQITALALDVLLNGGAYGGYKPLPTVHLSGIAGAANAYRVPALSIRSRIAYTHTVPRGHLRSPGASEVTFAVESIMDMAARDLGLDPIAFRANNMVQDGDTGPLGHHWIEVRSQPTLAAAQAALAALPPVPDGSRAPAGHRSVDDGDWSYGTGISFYNRGTHGGITHVALEPRANGTLTVWVPFPDQGAGQFTMARNAVVRSLGVSAELVEVRQAVQTDLDFDSGVGGCRVTVDAAEALAVACTQLTRDLTALRLSCGLTASGWQEALTELAARTGGKWVEGRVDHKKIPHTTSFCIHIARVGVDRGTGQVIVTDLITALDVATILNPLSHQVQIEGGIAMGFGEAVLEELLMEDGKVASANLGDYKIPSVSDLPPLQVVLVEGSKGVGVHNIKAIGETTNVAVSAAVVNAVAAAVDVRIDSLPVTAEKVYFALHSEEAFQ